MCLLNILQIGQEKGQLCNITEWFYLFTGAATGGAITWKLIFDPGRQLTMTRAKD